MSLAPHVTLVIGLLLALATAAAFNWSWVAQHTITSQLPPLTIRRPWWSLGMLFGHRRWLFAFLVGIAGWILYVVAVHLAPLSLVQAVSAGGIALLAVFAQRALGERLPRREWVGVGIAVVGLVFLAARSPAARTRPSTRSWLAVSAWFAVSWIAAGISLGPLAPLLAPGAGLGIAAGPDVRGRRRRHEGGVVRRLLPSLDRARLGLPRPGLHDDPARVSAWTCAGHRRALVVLHQRPPDRRWHPRLHERVPKGTLGALRVLAFICVVVGAAAVARKEPVGESAPSYPAKAPAAS